MSFLHLSNYIYSEYIFIDSGELTLVTQRARICKHFVVAIQMLSMSGTYPKLDSAVNAMICFHASAAIATSAKSGVHPLHHLGTVM